MQLSEIEMPFLQRAVKLMEENVSNGRFPYAALLALHGEILQEATNRVRLPRSSEELPIRESPLAHPELALADWLNGYVESKYPGQRRLQLDLLSQVVLYSSCEPCGMCIRALAGAGLSRVVFALSSATAAAAPDFGNSSEPNALVVQREYGFELNSIGPIEDPAALGIFKAAWTRVRSLRHV
jgi:tRNA(Arg) A34 adenosine deaminase TadA